MSDGMPRQSDEWCYWCDITDPTTRYGSMRPGEWIVREFKGRRYLFCSNHCLGQAMREDFDVFNDRRKAVVATRAKA